jgi:hypothetical protein
MERVSQRVYPYCVSFKHRIYFPGVGCGGAEREARQGKEGGGEVDAEITWLDGKKEGQVETSPTKERNEKKECV